MIDESIVNISDQRLESDVAEPQSSPSTPKITPASANATNTASKYRLLAVEPIDMSHTIHVGDRNGLCLVGRSLVIHPTGITGARRDRSASQHGPTNSPRLSRHARSAPETRGAGSCGARLGPDLQDIVTGFSQEGYLQDIVPQDQVIGPQEIVPAVMLSAVSAAPGMGRRG